MTVGAALDRAETGGGTPNGRLRDVVDATGAIIGHAFVMRSDTTVNIGHLQVMAGGAPRLRSPYWATEVVAPGFTAVGNDGMGWPLRCVNIVGYVDHRSTPPRLSKDSARVILPGLIGNTVLFASAWAGGLSFLRAARRAQRRKRGLCPMCAYDLRGLTERGCPECGWERKHTATLAPALPGK